MFDGFVNRVAGAAIAIAWGLIAAPASAQVGDVTAGLERLFEAGLKNTPPALVQTRERYFALKRTLPMDPRIEYAFGLVLTKQHKYADAVLHLSHYLQVHPQDAKAMQLRIWALAQDKRYADVLAALAALAKLFPKPSDREAQTDLVEVSTFLGAVYGYLELVRPDSRGVQNAATQKDDLLTRLGDTYLPAFDRGRGTVTEKLAQLAGERDAKQKAAEAIAEEGRQRTTTLLQESLENAATERDASQASVESLNDAQRELALISGQLASIARDRAAVGARIVVLQAQLAELQRVTSTSTIRDDVGPRFFDRPVLTTTTQTRSIPIDRYLQAAAIANSLVGLNKQAFDLDRRMLDLRTRGLQLGGLSEKEARVKAESEANAAKAAKRANLLERKLNSTKTPAAPRSTAPTGRMAMFSTYVPFPYDEEKERVLSWFAR